MKKLYRMSTDKYYYVRSWQGYSLLKDLVDKDIYTQAYSIPQAARQIRERIAKALHTPTYDVDINYHDIEELENNDVTND